MQDLVYREFTAVVPAYNEARRFSKVIKGLLKIKELKEVIFVDDGSTDDTKKKVRQFSANPRFRYFRHRKNKGKGAALKTGLGKAKSEIVLFLDADLENITSLKIKKIVMPVLRDEVDFARGSFRLARGRVTEIAVKPMMRILFPDLYFEQPISGQVCARKSFLETAELESHFGVDIGILLDAIQSGLRIVEIDIGKLEHKARSVEEKAEMAQQVMETMIEKAGLIRHKYKLVVFTLDDTLINRKSLTSIFHKLKIEEEIQHNRDLIEKGKVNFSKFLSASAKLFKGIEIEKVKEICEKATLAKYVEEVIAALKRRKYQIAVISSNFSPIVYTIATKIGADFVSCVELESKSGRLLGTITENSRRKWLGNDIEEAFKDAFASILRKAKLKPSQVIMVASSERSIPLLQSAGMGVAYKPKSKELKDIAEKTISLHAELLAIIE